MLSEEIEHHVEEEEKRMEGMFAQARKAGLDMDALGEQLAPARAELTEQFKASGIPHAEAHDDGRSVGLSVQLGAVTCAGVLTRRH